MTTSFGSKAEQVTSISLDHVNKKCGMPQNLADPIAMVFRRWENQFTYIMHSAARGQIGAAENDVRAVARSLCD
jgi:hypothetical protein